MINKLSSRVSTISFTSTIQLYKIMLNLWYPNMSYCSLTLFNQNQLDILDVWVLGKL